MNTITRRAPSTPCSITSPIWAWYSTAIRFTTIRGLSTLETSARGYRLAEIVSRHHRATLLVCAESAAGFNQIARQSANWIEATRPLVRRIYLTPEAPYRWTRFEFDLIEAGFIVLPAADSGWTALADLIMGGQLESFGTAPYARAFPPLLGTNELRWLDRDEPPPEIVTKLLDS